jgi:hypothetical protein
MEYDWEKAARKKFLKMFPAHTIHAPTGLVVIGIVVAEPESVEAAIIELDEADNWGGDLGAADIWKDVFGERFDAAIDDHPRRTRNRSSLCAGSVARSH